MLLVAFGASANANKHFYPFKTLANAFTILLLVYSYLIFIFPYTLPQKKITLFIIRTLLLLVTFLSLAYIFRYSLHSVLQPGASFIPFTWEIFLRDRLSIFIEYSIFAWGYWFVEYSILKTKENIRLEQEKLLLEKEHLQAQLAFLRIQFNPHFLYDTLNFLYSHTLKTAQTHTDYNEIPEAIMRLSEIMQYAVNDTRKEKVELSDEIYYLQNYIDIHQMQFRNEMHVVFETQGDTDQKRILPLTLISFVENAFKHGDLTDPTDPLIIQLSALNGHIDFMVRNRKAEQRNYPSTGIGSENIRKRLDLTYGEKYILRESQNDTHYTVHLSILD